METSVSEITLRRRVKAFTWIFIVGLILSGATAIPLRQELNLAVKAFGISDQSSEVVTTGFNHWLLRIHEAQVETDAKYPFLDYGTDWLAFGHFVIAVVFIGALRDPVRNVWLYTFGMIACVMVVPFAFILGAARGIPIGWRLIDCAFGVVGFFPVWYCRKWTLRIESMAGGRLSFDRGGAETRS